MFDLLKKIFVLQFLFTISLTSITCKKSPVQPDDFERFTFTFEDASCTEAWFNLKLNNLAKPVMVNIYKDNFLDKSFNIYETNDTTFYIENLLPKKNYEVYVEVQPANDKVYRSNNLRFTTMDTTSHEFTWQSWEFGTIGSSVLYDVAIIDENNIWAVGEINIADTSINGYTTYNAIHWDGTKWELKRILYKGGFWSIKTIFAFSSNNIWFSGYVRYLNGQFIELTIPDILIGWSINKLWGSSSEDLYAVGNNGNIAHWDGRKWTKIESGTGVDINDVFGVIDPTSNSQKVFCAVSFVLQLGELKILTIGENNKVDSLRWNTGRRVGSIWSNKGRIVYTSGGGVFHNKIGYWVEETAIPLYYTNRIRGNGLNDIFAVGDFALLAHFNGIHWNVYEEFLRLPATSFNSITVKGNIIAIVGYSGEKALIITGKRN